MRRVTSLSCLLLPSVQRQKGSWRLISIRRAQGAAEIESNVKAANLPDILQAMRDYDRFVQQRLLPQYGWMFPGAESKGR